MVKQILPAGSKNSARIEAQPVASGDSIPEEALEVKDPLARMLQRPWLATQQV